MLQIRDKSVGMEAAAAWILAATSVSAALRLAFLAEVFALIFAGMALWSLLVLRTARSRLQVGFALPLLLLVGVNSVWLFWCMVTALVVTASREKTWTARFASLLTTMFPAALLFLSRLFLLWIGYQPWWMAAAH